MKWTVKLVADAQPGTLIEQEFVTIERGDLISPSMIGLNIAKCNAIMESLQRHIVTAQVQRHGQVSRFVCGL